MKNALGRDLTPSILVRMTINAAGDPDKEVCVSF